MTTNYLYKRVLQAPPLPLNLLLLQAGLQVPPGLVIGVPCSPPPPAECHLSPAKGVTLV